MLKLAGNVFDMYDDPAFMADPRGQAMLGNDLKQPDELSKLTDRDFAVKIASDGATYRKYPIYNSVATSISCAYFLQKEAELPKELRESAGRRLVDACDKYDMEVPQGLGKYASSGAAKIVKIAEEAPKPSVITDEDSLYEMTERRLLAEFPRMTPENRVHAATEMEKVAGQRKLAQAIYDYIPKNTYGPLFKTAMTSRLAILNGDSSDDFKVDTFAELAKSAATLTPLEFSIRLREFDKLAGFDARYTFGLIDPFKACFGGIFQIEDSGEQLAQPVDTAGNSLDKTASDSLTVAQHIENLKVAYPKHSSAFKKEASRKLDPQFVGSSFERARRVYFS